WKVLRFAAGHHGVDGNLFHGGFAAPRLDEAHHRLRGLSDAVEHRLHSFGRRRNQRQAVTPALPFGKLKKRLRVGGHAMELWDEGSAHASGEIITDIGGIVNPKDSLGVKGAKFSRRSMRMT